MLLLPSLFLSNLKIFVPVPTSRFFTLYLVSLTNPYKVYSITLFRPWYLNLDITLPLCNFSSLLLNSVFASLSLFFTTKVSHIFFFFRFIISISKYSSVHYILTDICLPPSLSISLSYIFLIPPFYSYLSFLIL